MFTFVNLWNLSEHTLFDDITLPTGKYTSYTADGTAVEQTIQPDKEILINSIMDEVAELQPLTIDPDVMKMKIKNFFLKYQVSFEHLISMNLVWYSPIENTDRYEYRKDSRKTDTTSNDIQTASLKHQGINKVSTYDSDTLRDNEGVETEDSNTFNGSRSGNITDGGDVNVHTHGNIGVTTNQQMLTQELEFWSRFSFYKIVAERFMFELCLQCETWE